MLVKLKRPKAPRNPAPEGQDGRDRGDAAAGHKLRTRALFKLAGAAAGLGVASQVLAPPKVVLADQVVQNPSRARPGRLSPSRARG